MNSKSAGISAILTIILTVFMTVYSEINADFKNLLASLLGHHWVTKSVIVVVFFFILANLIRVKPNEKTSLGLINNVLITTILGFFVILGYYIWHFVAG